MHTKGTARQPAGESLRAAADWRARADGGLHAECGPIRRAAGPRQAGASCDRPRPRRAGGEGVKYVGICVSREASRACIVDSGGRVLGRAEFGSTAGAALGFLRAARGEHGEFVVGCRAEGRAWSRLHDACAAEGIEFKLGSARGAGTAPAAAGGAGRAGGGGSGGHDAEEIAGMLRRGAFPECHLGDRETRETRELARSAIALVQDRARACDRLRALLARHDFPLQAPIMHSAEALAQIRGAALGGRVDSTNAQRLVRQIEFYNREIGLAEDAVLREAARSKFAPQVRLLVSITGVDVCGATLLASEIDGIGRFSSPEKLVSMAGMCPVDGRSGDPPRRGRMKRLNANRRLQWLMIQAASEAVRSDGHLKEYYARVRKANGGGHAVAVTHVANKMLRCVWAMLSENRPCRYRNERLYQGKLARLDRAARKRLGR